MSFIAFVVIIVNGHTYYRHSRHSTQKMQILLLPLGDHAHLAKSGCLCTKQVLRASAEQTPGAGLVTRRRPDPSSQQMVWAKVPPGPQLMHEKESGELAPQNTPGTHYSWVGWWGLVGT